MRAAQPHSTQLVQANCKCTVTVLLTGAAANFVPLAGGKDVVVIQCVAVRVAGDGALRERSR